MQKSTRIKETIDFPSGLHKHVQSRARRLGVSFPEYVRYLVVRSVDLAKKAIPVLSKETEARVAESLQDLQTGRYTTVDPTDERKLNTALGI